MFREYFSFLLGLTLLLMATASAEAQINTCRLTYSLLDKRSGALSSTTELGEFSFDAKDEQITKFFQDEKSGIKIWVGSQIYGSEMKKQTSKRIEVAIAFGNINPETTELFRYADSAIAQGNYDKKSGWISVSKTVETNGEIYRFRFGCSKVK